MTLEEVIDCAEGWCKPPICGHAELQSLKKKFDNARDELAELLAASEAYRSVNERLDGQLQINGGLVREKDAAVIREKQTAAENERLRKRVAELEAAITGTNDETESP